MYLSDKKTACNYLRSHVLVQRSFAEGQTNRETDRRTDIKFCPIYEDNRCLPNNADLKRKFKIFNMNVDFVQNFMKNPKMNLSHITEAEVGRC